jgi:hypothetical protein
MKAMGWYGGKLFRRPGPVCLPLVIPGEPQAGPGTQHSIARWFPDKP